MTRRKHKNDNKQKREHGKKRMRRSKGILKGFLRLHFSMQLESPRDKERKETCLKQTELDNRTNERLLGVQSETDRQTERQKRQDKAKEKM